MRKLILALLLTLALTAPIYAGEMPQPVAPPVPIAGDMGQPVAASGEIQNGITETALTILEAVLSLF